MHVVLKIGLSGAALLVSGSALGGYKAGGGAVFISSTYAEGTLSAARATANGDEYIRCESRALSPSGGQIICTARNAALTYRTCTWYAPPTSALAVTAGMNGDTAIRFWWDTSGNCTGVLALNSSEYAPKAP